MVGAREHAGLRLSSATYLLARMTGWQLSQFRCWSGASCAVRTCAQVGAIVKELFGKEPSRGVNPDEVVAMGAAIQVPLPAVVHPVVFPAHIFPAQTVVWVR